MQALKILRTSALITVISAALGAGYSLVAAGPFSLHHVFTACFVVGAFVIVAGTATFFTPLSFLREYKLLDHSTLGDIFFNGGEVRRAKGLEMILVGIGVVGIAGVVEFIVHMAG